MIPRILHQMAPKDTTQWHPLWLPCQASMQQHFPDWHYQFWDDDDLGVLVRDHYPQYWDLYRSFPIHIMQIDFARFCLLHRHGGVYADLDIFCYKNFEEAMGPGVTVMGGHQGAEFVENSLMSSDAGNDFWLECMEESAERDRYVRKIYPEIYACIDPRYHWRKKTQGPMIDMVYFRPWLIFYITSNNLLATITRRHLDKVKIFPGPLFCNLEFSYHESFYTKHMHTGTWGREYRDCVGELGPDFIKRFGRDPSQIDFFRDYTDNQFHLEDSINTDKNSGSDLSLPDSKFQY